MSQQNITDTPQVVDFVSEGVSCKAFVAFGQKSLNMRSCQINFDDEMTINIEYLPMTTRVTINNGQVWFDTTEQSATEIESLFQTGRAPNSSNTPCL